MAVFLWVIVLNPESNTSFRALGMMSFEVVPCALLGHNHLFGSKTSSLENSEGFLPQDAKCLEVLVASELSC